MAATTDNTTQNKELAEEIATLMWAGKYDELGEYLHEDYEGHDPMFAENTRSAADIEAHFAPMMEAMSDVEYRIVDMVAEGDRVFHRGELSATHTGDFMGFPATNERFTVEDHIEWRFEDGKLAESWAQYDAIGMMRQMGMETPGPA